MSTEDPLPFAKLLGVTIVTGDVAKRAACAEAICRAAGRTDVPIHCGASDVLLIGPGQPHVPQYDAIAALPHRMDWPANSAIDFMRRTIRSRPGEITLLTIGPLTNAALLFAVDPEIPSLLKGMVTMGGCFFVRNRREWNILCDPIASAIVYKAKLPNHVSVGLDVTMQCQMAPQEVRRQFSAPPLDVVVSMAEVWFATMPELTFHDPLAAAVVFRPELCEYSSGEVTISIDAEEGKAGLSLLAEGDGGRHTVARAVNRSAFFEEYFGVFGGCSTALR